MSEKEKIKNALKCLEMDMLDNTQIELLLNYIERLQKELEEKTTILMAGADKVKQLEKENKELKRCIDAQKIMRKDMPKDTKLILMYSEDYKRIFKEE